MKVYGGGRIILVAGRYLPTLLRCNLPFKTTITDVLFQSTTSTGILLHLDGIVIGTREVDSLKRRGRTPTCNADMYPRTVDAAATGYFARKTYVLTL